MNRTFPRKFSQRWVRLTVWVLLALVPAACGSENPAGPPNTHGPTFTHLGPLAVSEVSRQSFAVSATDAEGDSIQLSLPAAPGFAGLVDNCDGTGILTLVPELGDAGFHTLYIRAFDGGAASFDTVSVSVGAVVPVSEGLFYEPPAFCRSGDMDTLFVWNEGAETLVWQPRSDLPGGGSLLDRIEVPAGTIYGVILDWSPPGPYPVLDTLRVLTNDPLHSRVEIPLRAEGPGFVDILPPGAPLLRIPKDGSIFVLDPGTQEAEIPVDWSDLDDCSGIAQYELQISASGSFSPPDVRFVLTGSEALLVAESTDVGSAFWRVVAKDIEGLTGPASEVRSWTVLAPPGQ